MKILDATLISSASGTDYNTREYMATVEDRTLGRLLVFYSLTDCERDEVTEGLPTVNAIVKIATHARSSETSSLQVSDEFEYEFTEAWENRRKLWKK